MRYDYDLEVFPNLFCVTFLDIETQETQFFGMYGAKDGRDKLRAFLDRPLTLIGFNNVGYDGPMLYAAAYELKNVPTAAALSQLFAISGKLIDREQRGDEQIRRLRNARGVKYTQLDLMKIMNFDSIGISLKQTAINLRWSRIQDLPLPYDHMVKPEEIALILDYNKNDVLITHELYKAIQPQIKLREEIGALYGVNVMNSSDSNMANVMLEKIYTDHGHDVSRMKDLRTKRDYIRVVDCIGKGTAFKTPILQRLQAELSELVLSPENKFSFKKHITVGNTTYDLGVGGIHSRDKAGKFVSDSDTIIRDADVASYYPNIILNNGLTPAHLGADFLDILRGITKERLDAKRAGQKAKADGLKITINSIFGKTGSDTFWLEDQQVFVSVTVAGQLYLLMLIEALELAGITVISANTDGIVTRFPRTLESAYNEVCTWWQSVTSFELEFTDYRLYVRSDVNNYLTVKSKGESKAKGRYVQDIDLKKGYKHPIVQKCLYEYFVNGVPVEDTLAGCTDILDYCISQKTGGDYQLEYHTVHDGITELQKTNRFYIANRGGSLVKRNTVTNGTSGLFVGKQVRLLNNYDPCTPFAEYDVDLEFYRREAMAYIEEIEPSIVQIGFGF